MDPPPRSTVLVGLGVLLFIGSMAVSAALAPAIGVTNGHDNRTLVSIQGGGPGWHHYGKVELLDGSTEVWNATSADSYFDVTMQPNGNVLAGFMNDSSRQCGPYPAPCARTGFQIIDPTPTPHVVYEYSFPVRNSKNSEVHAVQELPSGEFLLTDMDAERIFTVNRQGQTTWQWNASSFYHPPPDPTRRDWLHINDVDVIGPGRYLVSVRNANQLLVIQRGKGVVEVINKDRSNANDASCKQPGQLVPNASGDVRCGNPKILNHQHNPQWLDSGAVLVADSDNNRVVELHRAPNGTWHVAWTVTTVGGVPLDWPRDADRLANGHTLITDTLNRRIVEIDASGHVVWSYQTALIPYEADRLPAGETVGAPRADANTSHPTTPTGSVPVLSDVLVLLRAIYPGIPFWFGEVQLVLSFVAVGLVVAGVVDRYRT